MIGKILDAAIAIKGLAEMVKTLAAEIALWYIQKMDSETNSMIADAAAFAARAQTQEDRQNALKKWRAALSRPRITQ